MSFIPPPIHVEVHISKGTLHQLILVWGGYFLLIGKEEDVVGDGLVFLHTDEAVVVPVHRVEHSRWEIHIKILYVHESQPYAIKTQRGALDTLSCVFMT